MHRVFGMIGDKLDRLLQAHPLDTFEVVTAAEDAGDKEHVFFVAFKLLHFGQIFQVDIIAVAQVIHFKENVSASKSQQVTVFSKDNVYLSWLEQIR